MHTQKGFALLELMVATMLATLLAIWGAGRLADAAHESGVQASAAWMLSVRDGVAAYLDRYADTLYGTFPADALAGAGYADWAAPTLAELQADGLLPRGFPIMGPMAMRPALPGSAGVVANDDVSASHASRGAAGAYVRLFRNEACAGVSCRLNAMVYSRQPMLSPHTRRVDGSGIAHWLMATQGWGGWVNPARPHQLSGASFVWANPPWKGPALLPGTVVLAVSAPGSGVHYVRRHDARDPEFKGSVSVKGPLVTQSDLRVGGYLYLPPIPAATMVCASEGAVALRARGGLVICRDNRWQSLTGGVAGAYSVGDSQICQRRGRGSPTLADSYYVNPHTGSCTCPSGTTAFFMSESRVPSSGDTDGRVQRYICLG